jgi:gluconate 2-dehydrogenase gamma chain
VPVYIDQALASHPAPRWAEGFRAGLARLDAQSVSRLGRPFCKAKPADRDSLLAAWEAAVEQQDAAFLRDLVTATLEGAFCDPLYLGNRGARGWASLGFDVDPFAPTRTT